MTSVTEDKVELCTSESYDFLDIPVDKDRGGAFLDTVVAVVDGCRRTSNVCDREELTFLNNLSGVVNYQALTRVCANCSKMNICEPLNAGINAHGFFCASIIASQKIPGAQLGELFLGDLRGISPPPKIALYAIGCPSCLTMKEEDMVNGINAAIQTKVSVISMSLARSPVFMCDWSSGDFHGKDIASLQALRADIVTVVSAGNLGENHLKYIAKAAPWCLTIASCTSKSKFISTLTFKSNSARTNSFEIQVESLYAFQGNEWKKLRRDGNIEDSSCIMYCDNHSGDFVIRKGSIDDEGAPSLLFVLYLSKEQSAIISNRLDEEDLWVQIKSTRTAIADTPLVSTFSSRGPCSYYKEFMKPDLCAPGEMIAASWPTDDPLKGVDGYIASEFNVLSGTSFAVPQVAAAIALLRAKTNFSAMETISAVITTATKMHGKDPVAREFAYGAGMLNLKKALRPGLIYEETVANYSGWFQGKLNHLLLNLPYFSARFPRAKNVWECEFKRKVKSVEVGRCEFKPKVMVHFTSLSIDLESIQIRTSKDSLIFEKYGDEKEFSLRVSLPSTKQLPGIFGLISASLVWTKEDDDRVTVESPIILSSENVPAPHIMHGVYHAHGMYV